ncbi:MAG: hypothetical protein MJE68_20050 [Proteobacteria bacterium]|nr:hypothetical protein [Pseudomonadota bacterium]
MENEQKYNQVVHDPYMRFLRVVHPRYMWPDIAPSTEESRLQEMIEGTKVGPEDMVHNPDINQPESIPIADLGTGAHFTAAAKIPEIPAHEYRQMVRGLNEKQYSMVMYHRMRCEQAI